MTKRTKKTKMLTKTFWGVKRVILDQKGSFWVKKGLFYLKRVISGKKGHFWSKRVILTSHLFLSRFIKVRGVLESSGPQLFETLLTFSQGCSLRPEKCKKPSGT